jgi:uncharacterized membrane protein YfcA
MKCDEGTDCGVDLTLITFIIVGFVAQIIDGALGMAYGVSSTTVLLSLGVSPASASASVHTAEIFTTLVSGLSHLRLGNVDKKLFRRLLIPGVAGGILGAYILTAVPAQVIKPVIAFYLLVMGFIILYKAFRRFQEKRVETHLVPLAAVGGFLDAIGGGGWGPIVTSTIIARGHSPRLAIGSINLAEFFVTMAEALTFVTTIGLIHWQVIVGLIIGGVLAAPLAAYVCTKLSRRTLMATVGFLITLLSIRNIYQYILS